MPPLAPKRICANCGKDIGRRWKDYNLCASCIREIEAAHERGEKKKQKDDIPY